MVGSKTWRLGRRRSLRESFGIHSRRREWNEGGVGRKSSGDSLIKASADSLEHAASFCFCVGQSLGPAASDKGRVWGEPSGIPLRAVPRTGC